MLPSFWYSSLSQTLDKQLAVSISPQISAESTDRDWGANLVALLDMCLCLLHKAEMPTAADQRVVVPREFRESHDRTAQEGQSFREAAVSEQGQAMKCHVDPGKRIQRAHPYGLPCLADGLGKGASPEKGHAIHGAPKRPARINLEGPFISSKARSW